MFPTNHLIAIVYIKSGLLSGKTARTLHRFTSMLLRPSRMKWTPVRLAKLVWMLVLGMWFLEKEKRITEGGAGWMNGEIINDTLINWRKNKDLMKAMRNDIGLCCLNSLIGSMMFGGTPETLNVNTIQTILRSMETFPFDKTDTDIGGHQFATIQIHQVFNFTIGMLRQNFLRTNTSTGIIVFSVQEPNHGFNMMYNYASKKFAVFDLNYIDRKSTWTIIAEEGFDSTNQFSNELLTINSEHVENQVAQLTAIETINSALVHTGGIALTPNQIITFINTFRYMAAIKKKQDNSFLQIPLVTELMTQIEDNMTRSPRLEITVDPPSTTHIDNSNIYLLVSEWDTSPTTKTRFGHISEWNVSNVTTMKGLFAKTNSFNEDISKWNVSNVTNMEGMFLGASSFNQSLHKWNVSNVTSMKFMFSLATSFDSSMSHWNVSNVTSMEGMFHLASSFKGGLIGGWDVSNVTTMKHMFHGAIHCNPNLDRWHVNKVTNMCCMFYNATSFNNPLNNWNVSKVKDMSGMFYGATSFNRPLNNWNVSKVINMFSMFNGATAFNSSLNGWNISIFTDVENMFENATAFASKINGPTATKQPRVDDDLFDDEKEDKKRKTEFLVEDENS